MDEQTTRTRCSRSAGEILGTGGIKPLQASMENNTRQGDMADQASGNNEVHIALKLKQTDAKILQAIEEALWRIEKGTYGVCRDCGEPIAPARLQRHSVDARLHHLQGKAELVTRPARRCCRSSTATSWRCCCGIRRRARLVAQYDVNNTYQYIINREETQLTWVAEGDRGAGRHRADDDAAPVREAEGKRAAAAPPSIEEDARDAQAFVDRWRPRVERWPTRGTRRCSRVILGEDLEQKRFFEQALAGRTDLLGRRGGAARAGARRSAAVAVDRVAASSRWAATSATGARISTSPSRRLSTLLAQRCRSPRYRDTVPVGVPGPQPLFLNAAAVGETALSARALLEALLGDRARARARAPVSERAADAGSRSDSLRRRGDRRAGPGRAASAIPGAAVRARAARGDRARTGRSGQRADGRGAAAAL